MKGLILSVAVMAAIGMTGCKNETEKTKASDTVEVSSEVAMTELSFGVRGNCNMCKKTIEKAANSVQGVSRAVWDVDNKKIDVSFNDAETNILDIHKAIAASGYDTEKIEGDTEAYNNLPRCCRYDHSMPMNLSMKTD